MKYFCHGCKTEINLKRDRISGKYLYGCSCCGRHLKKADMMTDAQLDRKKKEQEEKLTSHPCSSCDEMTPLVERDNYGRCQRCQDTYGEID